MIASRSFSHLGFGWCSRSRCVCFPFIMVFMIEVLLLVEAASDSVSRVSWCGRSFSVCDATKFF